MTSHLTEIDYFKMANHTLKFASPLIEELRLILRTVKELITWYHTIWLILPSEIKKICRNVMPRSNVWLVFVWDIFTNAMSLSNIYDSCLSRIFLSTFQLPAYACKYSFTNSIFLHAHNVFSTLNQDVFAVNATTYIVTHIYKNDSF